MLTINTGATGYQVIIRMSDDDWAANREAYLSRTMLLVDGDVGMGNWTS